MKILFNKKFLQHNPESECEGAYRIKEFASQSNNVEADGEKYITLVHTKQYLRKIKDACRSKSTLAEVELCPASYEAICTAVGLTILASEQNDFAMVRPPGHHAKPEEAAGFCFFNNMAIATQKLINKEKKVFILDIDGHHGDGTQSIFYKTNKVFFCSIHQKQAYPWTGTPEEIGKGNGTGFTLNIPLSAGSNDSEFLSAVDRAVKKAKKFNPDIVGVSVGLDGYTKDRILDLNYSLNAYYECGYKLGKIFNNVFAVLEGGYHNDIKKCVDNFISGVNKEKK